MGKVFQIKDAAKDIKPLLDKALMQLCDSLSSNGFDNVDVSIAVQFSEPRQLIQVTNRMQLIINLGIRGL